MSSSLAARRCLYHASREAAARCPECGRFFCRECIVEHENRIVCADCLARLTKTQRLAAARRKSSGAFPLAGAVGGLIVAWLVFFFIGRAVLSIPDDFHAGKLWKMDWFENVSGVAR